MNDVMRKTYRTLTPEETMHMHTVKEIGQSFIEYCDKVGSSRELSLAKTKMEEAVMWAVKAITG